MSGHPIIALYIISLYTTPSRCALSPCIVPYLCPGKAALDELQGWCAHGPRLPFPTILIGVQAGPLV